MPNMDQKTFWKKKTPEYIKKKVYQNNVSCSNKLIFFQFNMLSMKTKIYLSFEYGYA